MDGFTRTLYTLLFQSYFNMKASFFALAAVLLASSLDLTSAATCDKTTQVDTCNNQECTYKTFNATIVPIPRSKFSPLCVWVGYTYVAYLTTCCSEDTKWDYYSYSCVKTDDASKCENIKQEDECLASQCTWHAYYEKKLKSGKLIPCTYISLQLFNTSFCIIKMNTRPSPSVSRRLNAVMSLRTRTFALDWITANTMISWVRRTLYWIELCSNGIINIPPSHFLGCLYK